MSKMTKAQRAEELERQRKAEIIGYQTSLPMEMLKLLAEVDSLGEHPRFNATMMVVDGVLTLRVFRHNWTQEQVDVSIMSTDPWDLERAKNLVQDERDAVNEQKRKHEKFLETKELLDKLGLDDEQRAMVAQWASEN